MLINRRRLSVWLRKYTLLRRVLKIAVRLFASTHYVGAVAALFDDEGRVLLVEHVFRTDHPWGLPGGWVARGETPIDAVTREVQEELRLEVDVRELLSVAIIQETEMAAHPRHLELAYYARLRAGRYTPSSELLSVRWADPEHIDEDLAPFQRAAVVAGRAAFDRDTERDRMSPVSRTDGR